MGAPIAAWFYGSLSIVGVKEVKTENETK